MSATTNKLIYLTAYDGLKDTASVEQVVVKRNKKVDLANAFAGVGFSSKNSAVTFESVGDMQDYLNVLENPDVVNMLALESDMTTTGTLLTNKVIDAAITAIGADQAGAYAIIKPISVVTVGAATTGLRLPVLVAGAEKFLIYIVENNMPNVIKVYPGTGDFIDALAVNVNTTVAAFSRTIFYTKKSTIAATSLKGWTKLTN